MSIFIAGLVLLVTSLVNLSLRSVPEGFNVLGIGSNLVVLATSLFLMAVGLTARRRRVPPADSAGATASAGPGPATQPLPERSDAELAEARHEVVQAKGEIQALRVALEEANARLEAARTATSDERSGSTNAEIVAFLSLLQSKGRFIDFVMDDITRYSDAQVGAAARVVHQGCASVIQEYFDIVPVREGAEGAPVTLDRDYNPVQYRLLGKVVGSPPFHGRIVHPGWKTNKIELPKVVPTSTGQLVQDVIQPAEIELG